MRKLLFAALLLVANLAHSEPNEPNHRCAAAALKQAHKLLTLHAGPDERIAIDPGVKVLSSLRNPANKAQAFDVLEVWGAIYKGRYRMRLIYAQLPGDCLSMGQEILEFADL